MKKTLTFAAAAAFALAAGTACAQATIDHNKALAGNVTPGDAPGYPITISQPGHYKLMGNLTVPAGTGILIQASDVTIDLNGFAVVGPGKCKEPSSLGGAVTCTNLSDIGINAAETLVSAGATIRNGTVKGFGYGILMVNDAKVQDVVVSNNGYAVCSSRRAMVGTARGSVMCRPSSMADPASRSSADSSTAPAPTSTARPAWWERARGTSGSSAATPA